MEAVRAELATLTNVNAELRREIGQLRGQQPAQQQQHGGEAAQMCEICRSAHRGICRFADNINAAQFPMCLSCDRRHLHRCTAFCRQCNARVGHNENHCPQRAQRPAAAPLIAHQGGFHFYGNDAHAAASAARAYGREARPRSRSPGRGVQGGYRDRQGGRGNNNRGGNNRGRGGAALPALPNNRLVELPQGAQAQIRNPGDNNNPDDQNMAQ
ncbi:MAG: hypothetical protein M1819_002487 [Sarea resinae]|nr:MAG: hypothetical protein M1819_002487 [Sarea resinae]